jgi:hypothetical protein
MERSNKNTYTILVPTKIWTQTEAPYMISLLLNCQLKIIVKKKSPKHYKQHEHKQRMQNVLGMWIIYWMNQQLTYSFLKKKDKMCSYSMIPNALKFDTGNYESWIMSPIAASLFI